VPAETTDCFMMTVTCQADINKLFVMRTQIFSLSLLHRFKIQPSTLQTSEWCEFSLCNAVSADTRSRHWQNSREQLSQIHGLLPCDCTRIALLITRMMTRPEHVRCQDTCQLTEISTASLTL